jgi:hypothetical protein
LKGYIAYTLKIRYKELETKNSISNYGKYNDSISLSSGNKHIIAELYL